MAQVLKEVCPQHTLAGGEGWWAPSESWAVTAPHPPLFNTGITMTFNTQVHTERTLAGGGGVAGPA
eukprot:574903-Pelagomonas_calceolata.AAC.1